MYQKQYNCSVLLKFLRSAYFLVENHIPQTTTLSKLVQLQVVNGDELWKRHIEGAANVQYTFTFSATAIIEAIDTWIDQKLEKRLKDSPPLWLIRVRTSPPKKSCPFVVG